MKTKLQLEGWAPLDLLGWLMDQYKFSSETCFEFEYESTNTIPNFSLRIYKSPKKCTLEEAMQGYLEHLYGVAEVSGQAYGYSEYTIEGYNLNTFMLGGHDVEQLMKAYHDDYLHILIEWGVEDEED